MKLTIRGYARYRGVSEGSVRIALKQGRISKDGEGKIDPEVADEEWEANSDPARVHTMQGSPSRVAGAEPDYRRSRAIHEAYNARLAKLQYEKESGQLVTVEKMKVDAFNAARITRDRILNVPEKVGPMLVGKTDIKEIKRLLKEALIHALVELCDSMVAPEQPEVKEGI